MKGTSNLRHLRRISLLAVSVCLASGSQALAQTATAQPSTAPEAAQDIVVTGFRASLNSALRDKRNEVAAIDSIRSEDVGKFPDSNLAESMQRVPGVALARGDGGEGKNISVRGLGAGFTRVRINGMEGSSQTGASDIYGQTNNGRSFDFNAFPTEIFSGLAVRKTMSADVEEGSLGATVDLSAPKPLSQKKDFILSATLKGLWNEVSRNVSPRASLLVSKKSADGRWGVLGAVAYQKRDIREVGYSAVDILSADTNGLFCSPIGVTPANPAIGAKGADANNCTTGLPRTGSVAAYNAVLAARRASLPNTPGSGAFFPRIPRYLNSTQNQQRIGGTLTVQFQPDSHTDISLDLVYSRFHVTRRDNYIEAISFGRSLANNGQPMTSIKDITLSSQGSVQSASYDGVDIRSEGLVDDFVSTFRQANVNLRHDFNERLTVNALVGINQAKLDNRQRFQFWMDANDKPMTFDYAGATTPVLGYGFNVADPANYQYAPGLSNGTVLGGYNFQGRPITNKNNGLTAEADLVWKLRDAISIKAGGQFRRSDFTILGTNYYSADSVTQALPAGVTLASITSQITGVDQLWGHGAPASWATIDPAKLISTFNLGAARTCGVECGATASRVLEEVSSGYVMSTFNIADALPVPVRGDIGLRFVHTNQMSNANVSRALSTSPTGLTGELVTDRRSYDNWLPSANLVIEPARNVLLRFSASKVMARPELAALAPSSTVSGVTRVASIQNPRLDPIKATALDAAVEWYFRPGALLSLAYFHKNISTFIQNVPQIVPFNTLGLPDALLIGTNTLPTELFTVSRPQNTPGGKLNGIELNAQIPFTFIHSPVLSKFGVLGNITHVTSKISYITATANGAVTATSTAALLGLSKNTASGTLYYEDKKFSIRGTINYRDPFILSVPGSPGSDLKGNDRTVYVDASASYNINGNLKLMIEAQNLTDQQNRLYVDSTRNDTLFQTRIGRTVTFGATMSF